MVELRTLTAFRLDDLERIMPGYTSNEKYEVTQRISADDGAVSFHLDKVALAEPYVKRWDHNDAETQHHYAECIQSGSSLGVFDDDKMIGIAIAEAQRWNGSLWIWEFGVSVSHQRRGIGRLLMTALAAGARGQGLRVMVAETQNTNVPAICFYRRAGFVFDGVDLSYYTNRDVAEGEVAIFMKRRLYE